MAKLFNRAKMTTATTGSGTVTLGSASNGFQTFAAAGVSNGDVVQYVIEENSNFEIGVGTYSSAGSSLTRSPTESSNSNAAITLAGQATVSITAVADDLNRLQHGGSDKVTVSSTGASVTGNLAVSGTVDGRDVASDGSKLDAIEANAKNDQTITAGGGLTGGGTGDVTISHSDTSSQASVNGSGRTYIQDITLDTYGHVTGLATAAETVVNTNTIPNNATITLSAGGALTGGGNFTTDQSANETITFNHSDTSSQSSVNNSSGTVIQDVTLDGYGHVTGLASVNLDGRYYTESEADSRFVNVTGDTMTGTLTLTGSSSVSRLRIEGTSPTMDFDDSDGDSFYIHVNANNFYVLADRDGGGNYGDWESPHPLQLEADTNIGYVFGSRMFHETYHPNADTLTTARTINGVSFNGSANITIADSTKLPLSGGTMTGELQLNARLDVGSGTQADAEIRIYKGDNDVSDHIQFYNGTTRIGEIGCQDTSWLRINQVTATNIYTPRYIRADGGFFVDGTAKGINGSGNFIGGTIAGASDYNTLIRSNGDDDVSGHTEWQDNYTIRLGTGADFRMWFDGTNTIFRNYAHSGGDIYFQGEDTAGANHALLYMYTNNTAPFLVLHQDGAERLRTVGGGCAVTGLMVGAVASPHNAGGLQVNTNLTDEKIVLSGSSNPYIRWQEGTTDKAFIRWQTDGYLAFNNQESGNFRFRSHSTSQPVNIRLEASDGDLYGSVYGTHANEIGFLDQDGNWAYRHARDSLHEWSINTVVEMSLSASTLDMKGNTITEVEDIGLRDIIYHDGDTDTYMQFATNEIRLVSGGSQEVTINTTGVRLGDTGNGYFQPVSSDFGSIQIDGGAHGGYEGYNIGGRAVFMHNNGSATGIYNDVDNEWLFYAVHNSYTRMYFNGSSKVETTTSGVTVNGDVNSTSDIRYKKNIKTIEGAVDKVNALRGVTFDWDNEAFPEDENNKKSNFTERATGVIAQDVEKVLPEAVRENPETGFKNVAYGNMVGLLIEAIKEQQDQINDLKAEIQSMKS